MIAFPLFVGLAVTSDRIIPILFGIRWQSATGLVRLQCALGIITCIGVLQAALITSRGKAGWWFYYQLFSTVTTFICIGAFARLGTEIMLGSIVVKSYAIWAIPVSFTLRIISMSAKDYLAQFVGPGLASFAMALAIYLERYLLGSVTGVYALFVDLSCGGVSYLVLILIFEKRRILAILKTMFPAKRLG